MHTAMKGSLIIQVLSALQRFNRSIIKLLRRWRLNGEFGVLLVAQGRLLAASGHGRLFKVWALRADLKSFGSNPPNSWEGSVKQIWCQICPEYVETFRFGRNVCGYSPSRSSVGVHPPKACWAPFPPQGHPRTHSPPPICQTCRH